VVRASTFTTCEKLFFKNPFPSKNLKNANLQSDTKTIGPMVAKLNIDRVARHRRQERQPVTTCCRN
jgi:hypothetical protein